MSVHPNNATASAPPSLKLSPASRQEIWQGLAQQASHLSVTQIDAFAARLAAAFFSESEASNDPKLASLSFSAAQLLKNNAHGFYYACSSKIEQHFRDEIRALNQPKVKKVIQIDGDMSLVSYEEMELKLDYERMSRSLEMVYAQGLAGLNMRLAFLLDCETLAIHQNPFRPEVFLKAINAAWKEFCKDEQLHGLLLVRLKNEVMFELAPIYHALNQYLIARGILPDLPDSFRAPRRQAMADQRQVLNQKIQQLFNANTGTASVGADMATQLSSSASTGITHPEQLGGWGQAIDPELLQRLAFLQQNIQLQDWTQGAQQLQHALPLEQLRHELPHIFQHGAPSLTLDLLSKVFEQVFVNQAIPAPIKELIALLQIPVLKAALLDKEFFFQEQHPARRLIELLSQHSAAWDPEKGKEDPLFLAMQKNVERVQKEFDQQLGLFDEVVLDLENFVQQEEQLRMQALEVPIQKALQREKFKQANQLALQEVAVRIATGTVPGFIETFLEQRWVKVLGLAFSVKDEKPHAVTDALNTMDDLIWSVQSKITLAQRQEMVNRLPAILAHLNKWLSLIKWEDADRMQFFADIAEAHAAIVRSPLEMSVERQKELAIEAAKVAAQRRQEKIKKNQKEESLTATATASKTTTSTPAVPHKISSIADGNTTTPSATITVSTLATPATTSSHAEVANELKDEQKGEQRDDAEVEHESAPQIIAQLERGVWLQFTGKDGHQQNLRLAWISPMRSLFIFTTSKKEKSISVSVEELERSLTNKSVLVLKLDQIVDRALLGAFNETLNPQ